MTAAAYPRESRQGWQGRAERARRVALQRCRPSGKSEGRMNGPTGGAVPCTVFVDWEMALQARHRALVALNGDG